MTTGKKDTSKSAASPAPKASKGKVSGKAEASPAPEVEAADAHDKAIAAKEDAQQADKERQTPTEKGTGIHEAFDAGRRCSETGAVPKPDPSYSEAEVKAWHEGYKSHANPNARGQVEGIESGYRKDY